MNDARRRILVVRGGAIGDFILTLPVLAALRRQFPESGLEVLGYPHIAELARSGGLVDEVRSIEARALAGFFVRQGGLDADWVKYFHNVSTIISYAHDPEGVFRENMGRCSTARFIAGPHRPDTLGSQHATSVFLEPLRQLGIFDANPVPRLVLPPVRDRFLSAGSWLALHPGSGSESKNWPEMNWRELINRLVPTTDVNLLLVGGEAEGGRLQRVSADVPPNRLQMASSLPLPTLARYLNECVGFVGHDSGISHLAAALGLHAVILWGPSNPTVWRPLGDGIQLLQSAKGLSGIRVDEVLDRMRECLPMPASVARSS